MMRRLIIDSIRNDPEWMGGNYTVQPRAIKAANVFFGIATSGGTLAYQQQAPTREAADKLLSSAKLVRRLRAVLLAGNWQWVGSVLLEARAVKHVFPAVALKELQLAQDELDNRGAAALTLPRCSVATMASLLRHRAACSSIRTM